MNPDDELGPEVDDDLGPVDAKSEAAPAEPVPDAVAAKLDVPDGVSGRRHEVTIPTTDIVAGERGAGATHGDVVYDVDRASPDMRAAARGEPLGMTTLTVDEMVDAAHGSPIPGAGLAGDALEAWLGDALHPERGTPNFGESGAGALSADLARVASAPPRMAGWLMDSGLVRDEARARPVLETLASARQSPVYQAAEAQARRGDAAAEAHPAAAGLARAGAALSGGMLMPGPDLGALPWYARILASGGLAGAENAGLTALTSETPEDIPAAGAAGAVLGGGGQAVAEAIPAGARLAARAFGGRRGALTQAGTHRMADLGGLLRDAREVQQDYPGGTREFGRLLRRSGVQGVGVGAEESLSRIDRLREAAGRTIRDVLERAQRAGVMPTRDELMAAVRADPDVAEMAGSTNAAERAAVDDVLDQVDVGGGRGVGPSAGPNGVPLADVERVKADLSRRAAYGALGERTPSQRAARGARRALTRGVEDRMARAESFLQEAVPAARPSPEEILDRYTRPASGAQAPAEPPSYEPEAYAEPGVEPLRTPQDMVAGAQRPPVNTDEVPTRVQPMRPAPAAQVPETGAEARRMVERSGYRVPPTVFEEPTENLDRAIDEVGGIRPSERETIGDLARARRAGTPQVPVSEDPEIASQVRELQEMLARRRAATAGAAAAETAPGVGPEDVRAYRSARRAYQGLSRASEIAGDAQLRRETNAVLGPREHIGFAAGGGGLSGLAYALAARATRANEHLTRARLLERLVAQTAPSYARRAGPAGRQAGELVRRALGKLGYVAADHDGED